MPAYSWESNKWWIRYRKELGVDGLQQCPFLTNWPKTGDHCPARNGGYKCMFGTKWECDDGDAEPQYICSCKSLYCVMSPTTRLFHN